MNAPQPAWLAALAQSVPVGIVVIDAGGCIVWCNHELLSQFDYAEGQLAGAPIERLVPERLREAHGALRAGYVEAPIARPMGSGRELFGRRADGSEFPLEIGLRPLETGEGRLYVATIVDITARRNAQDAFQRVIEAAPCGMLVVDSYQRVLFANGQLLQTFGYARDALVGQPLERLIPERHRAAHRAHLAGFAEQPATRRMGPGRDLTGLHSDGTEFPVEIGLSPVNLRNGPCVLAAVIDVSERKHAEMRLRRANADLEEFAYAASHDLRSPLRGISDLSDWITEDLGEGVSPSVKNNLQRLKIRVRVMDSLIGKMLDYARAGADMTGPERIGVQGWMEEIIELADPAYRADCRMQTQVATMVVQATPLGAVLRNLISNAIQHNEKSKPTVQVNVQPRGAYYEFEVIDDGPGIPPESRDRVFKLFQRLKRDQTGTGIGLALVKRIVESHGGSIEVTDRKDGEPGTRFCVLWPQATRRKDGPQ
jgi:PAS domain S-box-containing protein